MTTVDPQPEQRHAYAAFGRTVLADRSIPFQPAEVAAETDTRAIVLAEDVNTCASRAPDDARLIHEVRDFDDGPRLRVWRRADTLWIAYAGVDFRLDLAERRIHYAERPSDEVGVEFEVLVERVILPLYLLFESETTVGVHGGSVVLGDRAWLFIGDSGAGKSTTARVLVEQGAKLIADDLTLVDVATRRVLPGCPAVRLWEEEGAVALAVEDRPESALRDKRWFRLPETHATRAPVGLGAIFVLDARPADGDLAEASIARVGGQEAFAKLMAQTFDVSEPEVAWSHQRFRAVAALARSVPIYRYSYTRSTTGEPTHVDRLATFIADLLEEPAP